MNPTDTLVAVFGGIFAFLATASAIGAVLKYRLAPGAPHTVVDCVIFCATLAPRSGPPRPPGFGLPEYPSMLTRRSPG